MPTDEEEKKLGEELSTYPLMSYGLLVTTEEELTSAVEEDRDIKVSIIDFGLERGANVATSSFSGEIQSTDKG